MANPLKNLPTKPGRTAPSSRVKKIPKEGNKKFIGPESDRVDDGQMAKWSGEADHGTEQYKEMRRMPRKKVMREYSERYTNRNRSFDTEPQNVRDVYFRLNSVLSPKNRRLLKILMGEGATAI
jgi:hypothetical protein